MPTREPQGNSAGDVLRHLGLMAVVSVISGLVAAMLAVPLVGSVTLAAESTLSSVEDLPTELETGMLPQRTRILDSDGDLIAMLYEQNRVSVPLSEVSKIMRASLLAIEDYRFYEHGALDLQATIRAFISNQVHDEIVQGGSTLTQQLVKQTLLLQADTKAERQAATATTYARKLRELQYAMALEKQHSKDWILQRYLNTVYFGDGAYGIEAAARHYFSKSADELRLREAALLAGLVKNPTAFDPTNNPKQAKHRRNVVIERLADLGVISQERADRAQSKPLGLDLQQTRHGCVNATAPFFCDYVVQTLLQDETLGDTVEERKELLYTGGLTIRTTLNMTHQKAAVQSVRDHVYGTDNAIGALAFVEPGTGNVTALAQSRPMGNGKGETFLNYTVPEQYGGSSGFQAGSTFKAFVLSAAIKQGIPLRTEIYSPPVRTFDLDEYECHGLNLAGTWEVNNATESGTMDLYSGTRLSVNTFYAALEKRAGLCDSYRMARKMGINIPPLSKEGQQVHAAFTFGVANVSVLEMAQAYATFAARGMHCEPRPVLWIKGPRGHKVRTYEKQCERVMSKAAADAVNDILQGVQKPGGFGYAQGLALDSPSAGKTGTTNSHRAVWFIGYTPELVGASMIAGVNDQGHWISLNGRIIGGSYIATAHGSTTAGPMWGDAMHVIDDTLPDTKFHEPDPSAIKGVLTTVPSTYGLDVAQARKRLRKAGFQTELGGYVDSGYTAGDVAYTSPGAGASAPSGSTVVIYRSDGTPYVPPQPEPEPEDDDEGDDEGDGGGNQPDNPEKTDKPKPDKPTPDKPKPDNPTPRNSG